MAYIAPDHVHLGVSPGLRAKLVEAPAQNGHRPAVSFLFRSILEVHKKKAGCILLTGMGSDGALELKELKNAGARTAVQHRESATVPGMPGAALKLDPTTLELTPDGIVTALLSWAQMDEK